MVYRNEWKDEHGCAYTMDLFVIIIIYTDCDV